MCSLKAIRQGDPRWQPGRGQTAGNGSDDADPVMVEPEERDRADAECGDHQCRRDARRNTVQHGEQHQRSEPHRGGVAVDVAEVLQQVPRLLEEVAGCAADPEQPRQLANGHHQAESEDEAGDDRAAEEL
jgi:hypothetical protein